MKSKSRAPKGESKAAKVALSKVRALDLPLPGKAVDDIDWPENLADLTGEELGEQLTYWTAQVAYVGFQVALMDVERKAYEVTAGIARTRAYLASPSDKVTDKREAANTSREVVEANERHVVFDAQYRMLAALHKGYEAKYAAASRELSRREQEHGRSE